MTTAKTERLVNLTLALMATSRPLTVEELGRLVPGYTPDGSPDGGVAFRRMFERDKGELRDLGIPLSTEPVDPLWGDEVGYRVPRQDYALPDITLDPDEAAALGLAARLWSSAELSAASSAALQRLAAAGIEPLPPPEGLDARVDATEPAFGPMYQAVRDRQPVSFPYRRPDAAEATRRLQPWGVISWHGHWYVAGHDLDRGAARVFRLSRVTGPVTNDGPARGADMPAGTDLREMVARSFPERAGGDQSARLRLAPGAGGRLRRTAGAAGNQGTAGAAGNQRTAGAAGQTGTAGAAGGDVIEVPFADVDRFADVLVGYGDEVFVEAPAALRTAVVDRLRAVLAAPGVDAG